LNQTLLFEWVSVDNKIDELESSLGIAPDIHIDVNSIKHDVTGESLLHRACKHGHLAVAQLLVEGVGSNINSLDNSGATPLHYAVEGSNVLIVRYLVKYCGAILDLQDNLGLTPLEKCEQMEKTTDREEIGRIISKGLGKSPEKRTKISPPIYHPK
jgi:hypothetical protein